MTDKHESRYPITREEFASLMARAQAGATGEEYVFACDAQPSDHVHVRRLGEEGARIGGRVAVAAHGKRGQAVIYLAAPEARALAARLLDAADELDGVVPLVFMPRGEDEPEPQATPAQGRHRAGGRHRAEGPAK